MKLNTTILGFFIFTLFLNCSSSDNETDEIETTTPTTPTTDPSESITYNSHIKSLMNDNCNSCHGNPRRSGAPISLTTYMLVKDAVQNKNLVRWINDANNPMPVRGLMSQASRNLVQQWVDGGLLEN